MSNWARPDQYQAFAHVRNHLGLSGTDELLLQDGLHPASARNWGSVADSKRLYQVQGIPSQRIQVVNQGAPPMVLPGINVTRTIGHQWGNVKKPADICLVVDISGSMDDDDKLQAVKEGVGGFLEKFENPETTLMVISFNDRVRIEVPFIQMFAQKSYIEQVVHGLSASGRTALLDAVSIAINALEQHGDPTHIHAVIALADGEENSSTQSELTVVSELKKHPDIVFFGIAYGHDADQELLGKMASATRGLVVDSSPLGIQKIYQLLTTYI